MDKRIRNDEFGGETHPSRVRRGRYQPGSRKVEEMQRLRWAEDHEHKTIADDGTEVLQAGGASEEAAQIRAFLPFYTKGEPRQFVKGGHEGRGLAEYHAAI